MCISVKAFKKQDAVNFLIHEKRVTDTVATLLNIARTPRVRGDRAVDAHSFFVDFFGDSCFSQCESGDSLTHFEQNYIMRSLNFDVVEKKTALIK